MKKLLMIGFVAFMFSCTNQKAESLSCDPAINAKVKAEFATLIKSKRSDIAKESREFQRAFYRGLAPDQKFELWSEKFEFIKSFSWNDNEKSHLMKFIDRVEIDLFENSNKEELNEFFVFGDKWLLEANEQFGWNKEQIYYMFSNPFEDMESVKILKASNTVTGCECSSWSGDFCPGESFCEWGGNSCEFSSSGCGYLWMGMCQGLCQSGETIAP